jgi:hypothetical protein
MSNHMDQITSFLLRLYWELFGWEATFIAGGNIVHRHADGFSYSGQRTYINTRLGERLDYYLIGDSVQKCYRSHLQVK